MQSSKTSDEVLNDLIDKAACEQSLPFFVRFVFDKVYGLSWINNWHHTEIIQLIKRIESREIANAVINIPPRYGKTELVVVMWMAWTMLRNPRAKFIHASYSADLALANSDKVRQILKSQAIQNLWPIKMQDSADSKGLWLTQEGGGVLARSTYGQVTGFGAGVTGWDSDTFDGAIILDDPLKVDDARSDVVRASVNRNITETFHSRKNHPKVPIVIVMQRLHDDDASAYALAGGVMGEEFNHLKLSAITLDGKALWEHKHSLDKLKAMEAADRYTFAGQYMQEPYTDGGNVFKLNSFPRYDRRLDQYDKVVLSLDTAYKADQHNDPSCFLAFGCAKSHDDVLECLNERLEYPDLRRKLLEWCGKYRPAAVLIEDKASGQSLLQELQRETTLPIVAIKPQGDKITRAHTATHYITSQRVRLPKQAVWLPEMEKQLIAFPNSKHDDIIDALSQFIKWRTDGTDDDYLTMMDALYGKR